MLGFLAFVGKLVALAPKIAAQKPLVDQIVSGVKDVLHKNGLVDEAADLAKVVSAGHDADARLARLNSELDK